MLPQVLALNEDGKFDRRLLTVSFIINDVVNLKLVLVKRAGFS
jgi:hypothetical protein